ncbi:MAG: hypothetical protein AAB534_02545 [Patescibacteria group bacterium]
MNQNKKINPKNKDSFFAILNQAISSPTTLQKQVRGDHNKK